MTDREIDRLVAEKVMGWKIIPNVTPKEVSIFGVDEEIFWVNEEFKTFHPTTRLEDAWKVLDKFEEYTIQKSSSDYWVEVEIYDYEFIAYDSYFGNDESLTMAICKAALKTVGIEIN